MPALGAVGEDARPPDSRRDGGATFKTGARL